MKDIKEELQSKEHSSWTYKPNKVFWLISKALKEIYNQ
jgi:hypothetical protein